MIGSTLFRTLQGAKNVITELNLRSLNLILSTTLTWAVIGADQTKQNFEQWSLDYGVLIDSYLAENGVFKANKFEAEIKDRNQKIRVQ